MESREQTWLFRCVKGLFSTGGKESDIVITMIIGCLPKWPCPYPTSSTAPVRAPGLDPSGPPSTLLVVISIQSLVWSIPLMQVSNSLQRNKEFLHSCPLLKLPPSTSGILLLTLAPSVQHLELKFHTFYLHHIVFETARWHAHGKDTALHRLARKEAVM